MLELKFPKRIGLEEKSFEYLVNLNRKVEKVKKSEIRMDFSCTTVFVISHLAMPLRMRELYGQGCKCSSEYPGGGAQAPDDSIKEEQ